MNAVLKWVGGTVLAAATAAAVIVPKSEATGTTFWGMDSRSDSLFEVWNTERGRLNVASVVVSRGEARVAARGVTGVPADRPFFRFAPAVPQGTRDLIEERVMGELRGADALPTRYPVAVIVEVDSGPAAGGFYTQAVVLPERAGEPCVVRYVLQPASRSKFFPVASQRLLSTCAFHAAFGQPGEGTSTWLSETRGIAARFLQVPPAYVGDTSRVALGIRIWGWDASSEAALGCRVGRIEACERFVGAGVSSALYTDWFEPQPIDRSPLATEFPGVQVNNSARWQPENWALRSAMMAGLLEELGEERFGQLWRDPRGLQAAYAASSGEPFSAWVHGYLSARTEPYTPGPGIPMHQNALALGVVIAAASLAIFRSRRAMT